MRSGWYYKSRNPQINPPTGKHAWITNGDFPTKAEAADARWAAHVAGTVTAEQYADPVDSRPITLSDIDTTRALRTDNDLRRLVAAIHVSRPETRETNWLERKRTLDRTSSR